ncbi:MAG TPA: MBL fold metallo-hydrolase [Steroidobacteraceae bacterium]|nr:MBL fold metallo-hydrolase [Steroidobacteraceae bacterium]
MTVETIRHWRVGDVEVARIVEVDAFEDNISMLLKDETAGYVRSIEWLRPHFATPDGLMKISFQAFVLRSQGRSVMIDTCIGADRKREYDVFCNLRTTFLEDLAAAGFPAGSIDIVLCTHLHFDHVGWNTRLVDGRWVPTFPQARYLFGRQEFEHWRRLRETGGYHNIEHLHDSIDPVVAAGLVEYIPSVYSVTDEVSLFPTPGHTPGHVSVLIRSRGESAVITGDLMHHPIQLVDPLRHGNFDMDKDEGARTRQAFVERFGDSPALVIGSHFCDPTAGWIVRDGKGWKLKTQ